MDDRGGVPPGRTKSSYGHGDRLVSAADEQICPQCGRETFITAATLRVEPSIDQSTQLREAIDYELVPIEYEE
jgi:hypothetical protein